MNTASDIYIAFLNRLRFQKTSTATPEEFNSLAKDVLLSWIEEIRMYYTKHEKILEAANSIVVKNSIAPVNGIYEVPYKVNGVDVNAYLLNVTFDANHCNDRLQGIRLREHKNNNRYNGSSNWEVFYDLQDNSIVPYKVKPTVELSLCHVLFLKFPNIIQLNADGTDLVNSNLPSQVNNTLVGVMVRKYLEMTEAARIQTFS